ncbi:hypothetical protein [Nocardioides sp. B-3]|nr:hypothetical protein LP418_17170 [Nocardioides sp. B-3]
MTDTTPGREDCRRPAGPRTCPGRGGPGPADEGRAGAGDRGGRCRR